MIAWQKRCSKCRSLEPADEYYKDRRSTDGLQPQCRLCHKQNVVAYKLRSKMVNMLSLEAEVTRRGGGCEKCGCPDGTDGEKHEWHHSNPSEKKFPIKRRMRSPTKNLMAEVAKCTFLCPTCHYEAHHEMRQGGGKNHEQQNATVHS